MPQNILPHRLGDLEIKDLANKALRLLPHRLGDLEKRAAHGPN